MDLQGTIVHDSFERRELFLYLPPSYFAGARRFPVVYVHDRGEVFDPAAGRALEELERMFAAGVPEELLLVGIGTDDRVDDYSPWYHPSLTGRYHDFGGKGGAYIDFIADRLKPYIDGKYRTLPEAKHTGLIGESLGGLVSLYAAYLRPETFGKIGATSSSLWYPGFIDYIRAHPLPQPRPDIYIDVGSLEGSRKTNIQKEMVPRTKEAYAILSQNSAPGNRLTFVLDEGADHSLECFVRRFPGALGWLFAPETEPEPQAQSQPQHV
ncbi:alpha/beta hydrolase [Paenibacillus cymbidii]|uniref:alpha/beta hydrolase n=1 Tax=Paenibacillus cymbidii TaxID=1639034 RepID=UPI001EE9FD9C|nr:alpha/beta hydrolase-fold protein [Paenibacillus cymbidii]